MKWLFIHENEQSDHILKLAAFTQQYGIEAVLFSYDMYLTPSGAVKLHDALQSASRCIIFDWHNSEYESVVQYAVGFCMGRGAVLMLCVADSDVAHKSPWYVHKTMCFDCFDTLSVVIEHNINEYVRIDASFTARHKLFKRGIPITADVAASYVTSGDVDTLSLLFQAGVSANSRNSAGTPLICVAAREEQIEIVQYLISVGADIDAISEDRGYSAVMDATQRVNTKLVHVLVDSGARLDFISRDGQTVLILAVGANADEICSILVTSGADMDTQDKMGMSAFDYAKLFKKNNLVELFMKYKNA